MIKILNLYTFTLRQPEKTADIWRRYHRFPAKPRLRNGRRNSILMTRHYPDLSSASDWLNQIFHAARPIRSTTHIWVVTRHQHGISALVSQTSFGGETSGSVAKCRLFSKADSQVTHFNSATVSPPPESLPHPTFHSELRKPFRSIASTWFTSPLTEL